MGCEKGGKGRIWEGRKVRRKRGMGLEQKVGRENMGREKGEQEEEEGSARGVHMGRENMGREKEEQKEEGSARGVWEGRVKERRKEGRRRRREV